MYPAYNIHVDAAMTQFSLEYRNSGFVADQVFPFTKVNKESDYYFVYGREQYMIPETIRGPSSEYNRVSATLSTVQYSCQEYGLEIPIDDRERDNADAPLNPDKEATELATKLLLLAWEKRVIDIVTSTSLITQNTTLSGTDQWSDYTNSDPLGDIDTGAQTILKAIGEPPNTLIMGREVFDKLKWHPDITDLVKYTQKAVVTPDLLASCLSLDRCLVAHSIYNTAKEGATESISFLWGKKALLAYIDPNAGVRGMTLGKSFGTKDRLVERYREDKIRSDVVRALHIVDEKLICANAGYLIADAVA